MATQSETVRLIFQGVDQTSTAIAGVSGNIKGLSGSLQSVTGPLAGVTKSILALEAAAAGIAIALGKKAFDASVKLESATLDLQKVFDDTDGDINAYVSNLGDLATQYGVASAELIQSAANFKQAGFTAQESAQLVKNSLDLVIAGDLEAAQASDLLVASLKGFGAEASQAGTIIDLLNGVSNKYATNVQELAIGFSQLSPIAGQVNLSFKETAGILTPAIEVFRSGSEASRAFRTILLRLADPTPKIQEAFKQLGVQTTDLEGKQRSARDILFDVAAAFQSVDQNAKAQLSAIIAGKDQAGKFAAVMDNFNKVLEISSDEFNTVGSAAKEVEIRLSSTEKVIDVATVKFNQLAAAIGTKYRAEIAGVVAATGDLALASKQLVDDGKLDRFFNLLKPLLTDLESTIRTIAANLPQALDGVEFDKLIKSLQDVGVSLDGLFNIDLTTVEGLRSALQLLVDGLASLNSFTAGAIEGLTPLIQGIGQMVTSAIDAGPELAKLAGNIGGIATALNTLLPVLGVAATVLGGLAGAKAVGGASAALVTMAGAAKALPGVLGASTASLAGLGAAAGAAAGVAGVGLLSFEAGKLANEATGASDKIVDFIARVTGLDDSVDDLLAPVSAASLGIKTMGDAVTDTDAALGAVDANVKSSKSELIDWSKEIGDLAVVTKGASTEISDAADELSDYEAAAQGLIPVTEDSAKAWRDQADALGEATLIAGGVRQTFVDSVPVYTQVAKGAQRVTDTLETLAEKGEISKDKYAELVNELQKAEIQAKVELDIAQLENNADIAKAEIAAFETITVKKIDLDIARLEQDTERARILVGSIDNALGVVSGNINNVIGAIGALDSADNLAGRKFDTFQRQLEIENQRFDQIVENQTKLIDAQVDNLQAQTDRLRRGDALIKINGDGLEPELEAFMFRILERIQVRANGDGAQFLLGFAS